MELSLDNIELQTKLPDLPDSISIYTLKCPSLKEREPAIKLFIEILELGSIKTIELQDSIIYASKRGEVEFFPASGSIWARDALALEKAENEECTWKGLEKQEMKDEIKYVLNEKAVEELQKQSYDILRKGELLSDNAVFESVDLDQYVEFNEKGEIIKSGAGSATIKFLYKVDKIPVFGAGAKTYVFADSDDGKPIITGAFHAWREILDSEKIRIPPIEESLASGFLKDPEFIQNQKKGYAIELSSIKFGYYSMPAFYKQSNLFPVFETEGSISHPKEELRFKFLKHHHAIPSELYKETNIHAYYLISQL